MERTSIDNLFAKIDTLLEAATDIQGDLVDTLDTIDDVTNNAAQLPEGCSTIEEYAETSLEDLQNQLRSVGADMITLANEIHAALTEAANKVAPTTAEA